MERQEIFSKIAGLIDTYLDENEKPSTRVIDYKNPRELEKVLLSENISSGSIDKVIEAIEKYLKYSVRTGHKQYLNQLWAGFSLPAFLGDVFTGLTNTSMSTFEISPVATLLEHHLTDRMCRMIGFDSGEGLLVSGGSNANLLAVLAARNQKVPGIKESGIPVKGGRLKFFISDQAHFSFLKAANICGLGMNNVVKVESDERGRMIPSGLCDAIKSSRNKGDVPFLVGATSGTTVLTAFDPIDEIAEIANEHGLWLHVDGSLGASVILSSRHRGLLNGIEKADSVTWTPHKMMGLPLICSAILMKKKGILFDTSSSSVGDEQYIFHQGEHSLYDLGPKSLQCGRKVDSLKLWLSWIYYGDDGFGKRVEKLFSLAAYASEKVKKAKKLELLMPPQSVSVCFRYIPDAEQDINKFNIELREKLLKSGLSIVNYAKIGEKIAIRLVTVNPELENKDIDIFFDNLLKVAEDLEFNPLNY